MKKIIVTLLIVFTFSSVSSAKTVTLSWDPSPSPDVAGYKLYYKNDNVILPFDGTGATEGASPIDFGNTMTAVITGLSDIDTHYFTVTAYDGAGYESAYSNIVASNPLPYQIDTSFSTSPNVSIVNNIIKSQTGTAQNMSWNKYLGVTTKGEETCVSLKLYFNDGTAPIPGVNKITPWAIYAKVVSTGEIISTEKYFFVDNSYKNYNECIIYKKSSVDVELVTEFGEHSGQYECQINSLTTSLPIVPPVEVFYLKQLVAKTGIARRTNAVFGFQQPIPFPDTYRVVVAKTLEGALTRDPKLIISDYTVTNTGQETIAPIEISAELENGVFVSIASIIAGVESTANIASYLFGNITGNSDEGSRFKDVIVNGSDIVVARNYARYRISVPLPGNFPAVYLERTDVLNRGRIYSLQYSIVRSRAYKRYYLYTPW